MCCHLRLNNKQPVNILNQYWIHLLLKDHYFKCIFIPTHFMTSPSSKNLQMSWFSLLVLKFLLCFILKFLLCFTCRNFQSAALFLPVGSFSVLHILTYCTFQCAVVCLPIVPFCAQLYFCLLYISVLVPVSLFLFQGLYLLVCFWILTVILLSDLLFPYLCTEAGASSTWWGLSLPLAFLRSSALSW